MEFEVHHEGSLRIAQNMLVIDVESHGDLADALRAEPRAGGETDSHVGADVTVLSRPESRDAKRMPGRKSIARQGKGYALALSGGDQESATILPFPERLRA
ncbi:hypothetical protein [Phaeobacter sp. HF9A]|uniref:hypothetical protein n=1 Tax=Phaeobacter sp. HF9A TaxID=2721561 RepID=UPI0020CA763C|nr:hypothetical protein [Phaeobacter sp. HF9A]